MKSKTKYFLEFFVVLILFILISYLVQSNLDFFESLVKSKFGLIFYFIFVQISLVFAPISSMPLVPIISKTLGPFSASIINWILWVIGSVLIFFICRKFGVDLLEKFIDLEDISKLEDKIPETGEFYVLLFLRAVIPVDILSYLVGLLTDIPFKTYFYATVIGLIPLAFFTSYFGAIQFKYQVMSFVVVLVLIFLFWGIKRVLNSLKK